MYIRYFHSFPRPNEFAFIKLSHSTVLFCDHFLHLVLKGIGNSDILFRRPCILSLISKIGKITQQWLRLNQRLFYNYRSSPKDILFVVFEGLFGDRPRFSDHQLVFKPGQTRGQKCINQKCLFARAIEMSLST